MAQRAMSLHSLLLPLYARSSPCCSRIVPGWSLPGGCTHCSSGAGCERGQPDHRRTHPLQFYTHKERGREGGRGEGGREGGEREGESSENTIYHSSNTQSRV